MLKEEISGFADGAAVDEKDIAAVIGYADGAVIFEDDYENLFFLPLEEPQTLEVGTIEKKANLTPVDQADALLREKILAAGKKGRE